MRAVRGAVSCLGRREPVGSGNPRRRANPKTLGAAQTLGDSQTLSGIYRHYTNTHIAARHPPHGAISRALASTVESPAPGLDLPPDWWHRSGRD
eukprot:1181629-Prorocentrum_minimum.AAC.8